MDFCTPACTEIEVDRHSRHWDEAAGRFLYHAKCVGCGQSLEMARNFGPTIPAYRIYGRDPVEPSRLRPVGNG